VSRNRPRGRTGRLEPEPRVHPRKSARRLKAWLALYAFAAILVAFFPVLFGRLPVPADSVGQLLPDEHFASANPQLSDVATQFLPMARAARVAWLGGRLPFRDPSVGCGAALWANPIAQVAVPTSWLLIALPVAWAFAVAAAVKLFFAAVGAFLFLRRRHLSAFAAGWGGFAYGFSLSMTGWLYFPHSYPAALLPWVLVGLERLARGERGGFLSAVAAVLLLLLGGHPESEFLVALAGAAFLLAVIAGAPLRPSEKLRRLGAAFGAAFLAAAMSAAYTIPATIAVAQGERAELTARGIAAAHPHLEIADFVRLPVWWKAARFWIVPEAQGNPRDGDAFGVGAFAGRAGGYAGILVLALALGSFGRGRAPRSVQLARCALILLIPYVLWYRPLRWLLEVLPGVREIIMRLDTNRADVLAVLLLAFLAATQFDHLRQEEVPGRPQKVVLAALAGAVLFLGAYFFFAHRPLWTLWRATSFLLPVLLLAGAFLLLSSRNGRSVALAGLLLGGTALDLLRIGARFDPGTRPADYYPETGAIRRIREASAGGRFAIPGVALTGLGAFYGLQDIRVHDPVASAAYEDVLRHTLGDTGPEEYFQRITRMNGAFLDFLDVRALSTSDGRTVIRRGSAESAFLPDFLVGVPSRKDLLERLATETDFRSRAFFEGTTERFTGAAEVLSEKRIAPETMTLRVRTEHARVLILPESQDGGWTAAADGREVPTFVANGAFLGIRVPAGESTLSVSYRPPGAGPGALLSLAGISTFLLLVLGNTVKRKREARSPGGSRPGCPLAAAQEPDGRANGATPNVPSA
jgi:Bacterial membrane protein YfhO